MADRIDSPFEMDGTLFLLDGLCPHCGADITDDGDGMRMRIVVGGHAEMVQIEPGKYELGYSYSEDDKSEEYVCYECDQVILKIVKD